MNTSQKSFSLMIVCTLIHGLILYNYFGGHVPAISSVLWSASEGDMYISYPFALSRYWDLLLFPMIFFCATAVGSTCFWRDINRDETGDDCIPRHLPSMALGGLTALIYAYGYWGGFMDKQPMMNELFTLIQWLIGEMVFLLAIMALNDTKTETIFYVISGLFVSAGITTAFFCGLPFFLVFALPASVIALYAIGFIPHGAVIGFFSDLILYLKKKCEKKEKTKNAIETALALKVSSGTKSRIQESVNEITAKKNEIAEMRKKAIGFQSIVNELGAEQRTAEKLAKEIVNVSGLEKDAENYKIAQTLSDQKEETRHLLLDCYAVISVDEERISELLDVLVLAEKEVPFCREYDALTERVLETQKKVKKNLEAVAPELLKKR
jgi:hypothetical protein